MVPALHSEASELLQFVSLQTLLHANANFTVTHWKQPLHLRSSSTCFIAAEKKLLTDFKAQLSQGPWEIAKLSMSRF